MTNICQKFHSVVVQLKKRYNNRKPLIINDEYDVQYFLMALLKIHFDDIRPEEWTPSYAGSSKRMDFLLKSEQIVVETKKTRDGLDSKNVGDELTIDIAHYKSHPDCKTLVCFIYDPDHRLTNPIGLENDLYQSDGELDVRVIVMPK